MIMVNFLKVLFGWIAIAFAASSLTGCVGVQTYPNLNSISHPVINYPQENARIPAILVDGVPYHKEEVEELPVYWKGKAYQALLSYSAKFEPAFHTYMDFLSTLRTEPPAEWSGVAGHHELLSTLTAELYSNFWGIKELFTEELNDSVIAKGVPFKVVDEWQSDDLFPKIPVISVDGDLYPVFVVKLVQDSVKQQSEKQWAVLNANMKMALETIYSTRENNVKKFTVWMNKMGTHFAKPIKVLTGKWEKEYAARYDAIINEGVDTKLPERLITEAKDKANIRVNGYLKVLAFTNLSSIDKTNVGLSVRQTMTYAQLFAPHSMLMYKMSCAGEVMGIDTSGWNQETRDQVKETVTEDAFVVGVGVGVESIFAAVAGFTITAAIITGGFNPVVIAFEAGFVLLGGAYLVVEHFITRGKKIEETTTELTAALHNELSDILSNLRSIPELVSKAIQVNW